MMNKSIEFWVAIAGMTLYVSTRNAKDDPLRVRLGKAVLAGALAFALAPDLAPWVGDREALAAVLIMAIGETLLDVLVGIAADRETIKAVIIRRLGGGGK